MPSRFDTWFASIIADARNNIKAVLFLNVLYPILNTLQGCVVVLAEIKWFSSYRRHGK